MPKHPPVIEALSLGKEWGKPLKKTVPSCLFPHRQRNREAIIADFHCILCGNNLIRTRSVFRRTSKKNKHGFCGHY
jgi:hypothetical protein